MMSIRLRLAGTVVASLALVSCGGDTGPTYPDTTVASVVVSGAATVNPGGSTQLTATAKNASGATLSGMTATWASNHTDVATVNSSGLVSALANGTSTITATISGVPGILIVTVGSTSPTSFPSDASVEATAGNTFNPNKIDIAAGGTVTWTFSPGYSSEHNVTFDTAGGAPSDIPNTASGSVARTFSTAGTFTYQCTNHYGMTGTVIVH